MNLPKRHFRSVLLTFLFLALPGFTFSREVTVTLLFTSDHHGQLDPLHSGSGPVGGVTRRMALIQKIRAEVGADHVVLVDSGDLFDGTAFSELTRGEADCEAYHLMGYDAVCLGEHDFDYGQRTMLDYRRRYGIPWVAANVNRGGQPFIRAYILKATGVRVGLIGFSNRETPSLIGREATSGLTFNPPGLVAKGLHSIFKKDADVFVVMSRQGLEEDKKFVKDNPFIHVVLGGRSSVPLKEAIVTKNKDGSLHGPILCQAGSQGLYLGRLDMTIDGRRDMKTKTSSFAITDYKYQLIPINADLPEEPRMVELLAKYREALKDKPLDEVLANVTGDFTGTSEGDSLAGEMITDAMRKAAGTEIAFIPNGVFKSGFHSGDLTREILYEICPSEGTVTAIDVPGAALKKMLSASLDQKGKDNFLQVSGITVERAAEGLQVFVAGEPLNEKRRYQVAVNDFLAGGGAGYDVLRTLRSRRKTQWTIRGLLEEALKAKGKLAPTDLEKRWK